MKKVYMSFSADVLHYGHIEIMKKAAEFGDLIIGVLTDDVITQYRKPPLVSWENRCKLFENLEFVSQIIKKDTLSYEPILAQYHPDIIVHGDDWKTGIKSAIRNELLGLLDKYSCRLVEYPYNDENSVNILEGVLLRGQAMPEVRRGMLRKLLQLKPYIRVMEAHDGLTGLIVETAQYQTENETKTYDAMWESSLCDSTSRGKPDIELIDWSARIARIQEIMEVTSKPVIVDGDTGGQKEHFIYIVQSLERIGVSAIIIEDKTGAKKNSLFGTEVEQTQDTPQHFAEKIKAAKAVLSTDDFMIIARIESLILEKGEQDALERAECYIKSGADGIMIHSRKREPDEVYSFCQKLKERYPDIPIVVIPTTYNNVSEEELAKHGADIIIHANHLIRSAFPAMEKAAVRILEHGSSECVDDICMPIKQIIRLIPDDGGRIGENG